MKSIMLVVGQLPVENAPARANTPLIRREHIAADTTRIYLIWNAALNLLELLPTDEWTAEIAAQHRFTTSLTEKTVIVATIAQMK
jgi:hypothetical protein